MPLHVCLSATLKCSMGVAPSQLVVLPVHREQTESKFAANIMDHVPMVNIMPFGMCMSLANPAVASATSAALGVLTPMPCIPNTPAPWVAGAPTVLLDNAPALDNVSTLNCIWAGVITVLDPGEHTVQIP
jgi:hypothetical protein